MNIRELTYVALKITGILSFLWGLKLWAITVNLVPFLDKEALWSVFLFIFSLMPFIFTMIISFLLLARTDRVIEWFALPEVQTEEKEIKIEVLMSAAFAILGVALLVVAISRLIYIPGQIQAYLNSVNTFTGETESLILSSAINGTLEILIKIALGLYLFFGGDGLIRFWKRYRDRKLLID